MEFNYTDKCVYILGVGQIGLAAAKSLIARKVGKIVIHALTKDEVLYAKDRLIKYSKGSTTIETIYGDIFTPCSKFADGEDFCCDAKLNVNELYDYFYNSDYTRVAEISLIYQLIKKVRPDIIIDAINTATVLSKHSGIDNELNQYLKDDMKNDAAKDAKTLVKNYLINDYNVKLNAFVLGLKQGIERFGVKKYIKVSTTGLGGMGFNMKFTHGDTPDHCLSRDIMGKLSASGSLHQLLWALARTPGMDISIIVPSTCVGWDEVFHGPIVNNLGRIDGVDCEKPIQLRNGDFLSTVNTDIKDCKIEIPQVWAGENLSYSAMEIKTLTSYGQMEAITKEEVSEAVIKTIEGTSAHDLIKLMEAASLKSSYIGRVVRDSVISKIENLESAQNTASVVTGNLGPTVAKHLGELTFLKIACSGDMRSLLKIPIDEVIAKIEEEVLSNKPIRSQLLSVGIPIVLDGNRVFLGNKWLVPEAGTDQMVSAQNLEGWIEKGWVDLRKQNILRWRDRLKLLMNDAERRLNIDEVDLSRDIRAISSDFDTGEILSYLYILEGAGRRS